MHFAFGFDSGIVVVERFDGGYYEDEVVFGMVVLRRWWSLVGAEAYRGFWVVKSMTEGF